jgi:hypothetical protein
MTSPNVFQTITSQRDPSTDNDSESRSANTQTASARHTTPQYLTSTTYADDRTIQSYRSILAKLNEQKCMFQIHAMQLPNYHRAISNIDRLTEEINNILRVECDHDLEENDYIDIDVDNGRNISYCKRCFLTFST